MIPPLDWRFKLTMTLLKVISCILYSVKVKPNTIDSCNLEISPYDNFTIEQFEKTR